MHPVYGVRRRGEEKYVVFAAGEGFLQVGFGEVERERRDYGETVGGKLGGDTAGAAELREVGCQAVANVHGARHPLFGENSALGEVGLRATVGLEEDFGVDVGGTSVRSGRVRRFTFLEQGQPSGGGPQRSRHCYEMPGGGCPSGHGCALDGPDEGNGDEGGG